jgi:hypothetical protein
MNTIARTTFAAALFLFLTTSAWAQDDATGTPLEDITHDMKVAANQLSKKTTDNQTQQPQMDAVAKLDKLIEELEKERQRMGGSSSPNPTRPATYSAVRSGPGGMGELHGTRDQGDRWGQLPPHERDRILQSLTEGFPAHYQAILEAYYKRLAVEKRAEDDPAAEALAPPPKAGSKEAPKSGAKDAAAPAKSKAVDMPRKAAPAAPAKASTPAKKK